MSDQITKKQLRSFGLTVGGVFLLMALWPVVRRGQELRLWALIVGFALLVPGIVVPQILGAPYKVWMKIGHVLGWINTKIILTIVFYTVFTPAAFIARLFGKDPMNRAYLPDADTYRVVREPRATTHMRHQF